MYIVLHKGTYSLHDFLFNSFISKQPAVYGKVDCYIAKTYSTSVHTIYYTVRGGVTQKNAI